ncbi:peptidoglycan-binding protein LysM [Leuconostoc lactis]|uniref:peptidoglycan-binding protein LysM n=1 Tax=Leuconostoc lactis TaxID=1246 RepID=UPI002899849B|nr:peptidoglycan-binding protein LysM [Leuconostoc lactis]
MNDFDPNKMSRSARSKQQKIEPQFARKSSQRNREHKRLRVFLIVLGLLILSSVPVYGFWANHKAPQQQVASSVSHKKTASSKKASSVDSSSSSVASSDDTAVSESAVSSSDDTSSVDESASSSAVESSSSVAPEASSSVANNTAVLGASQTLYNFAVTHGMTTDQVIALNPGLTVSNYTQYAGRDLNIR